MQAYSTAIASEAAYLYCCTGTDADDTRAEEALGLGESMADGSMNDSLSAADTRRASGDYYDSTSTRYDAGAEALSMNAQVAVL